MTATLYILNALVDNWDDLTLRATRILHDVSKVVAPASVRARNLLRRCDVHTPVIWLNSREPPAHLDSILDALQDGDVAWLQVSVTEWSGPDYALATALCEHDVDLVPIPGSDSAITGLVMSGLPASRFAFLGTLPVASSGRRSVLQGIVGEPYATVCYARAPDLAEILDDIRETLGERRVTIYPEQDVYRETLRSNADGTSSVTLVIQGEAQGSEWPEDRVRQQVRAMLAAGDSTKDIARSVAASSGWSKRQVYEMATRIRELCDNIP